MCDKVYVEPSPNLGGKKKTLTKTLGIARRIGEMSQIK